MIENLKISIKTADPVLNRKEYLQFIGEETQDSKDIIIQWNWNVLNAE